MQKTKNTIEDYLMNAENFWIALLVLKCQSFFYLFTKSLIENFLNFEIIQ